MATEENRLLSDLTLDQMCDIEKSCDSSEALLFRTVSCSPNDDSCPDAQAYALAEYQRELKAFFELNPRMEKDFYRKRKLSVGDLIGCELNASSELDGVPSTSHAQINSSTEQLKTSPCHYNRPLSSSPENQLSRHLSRDKPQETADLALSKSEAFFEDEESIRIGHKYMVPHRLARILGKSYLPLPRQSDSFVSNRSSTTLSSICIGTVHSVKVTSSPDENAVERALVHSHRGKGVEIEATGTTRNRSGGLEDVQGATVRLDDSPSSIHHFSQADVPITSRGELILPDFMAAQDTNLAGWCLDIDNSLGFEIDRLNSQFFRHKSCGDTHKISTGEAVSSTNYHIDTSGNLPITSPAIVDDLADEDYYRGPTAVGSFETFFYPMTPAQPQVKPQPRDNPSLSPLSQNPYASKHELHNASQDIRSHGTAVNGAGLDNPLLLKKQVIPSGRYKRKYDGDESPYSFKKARIAFHQRLEAACSSTSISTTQFNSPSDSLRSLPFYSPMATALKGFAGQFDLSFPKSAPFNNIKASRFVFGYRFHTNGQIINKAFVIDPRRATTNLTERDLHCDEQLHHMLKHCTDQTFFAMLAERTTEEERFRNEANLECTMARLEGVAVGYYRYFAGHLTIEEYIAAKMCVCWDECLCNKLCTRFGDLICLCSGNIELDNNDSQESLVAP